MAIIVPILTNYNAKGVSQATRSFQQLEKQSGVLGKSIGAASKIGTAAMTALGVASLASAVAIGKNAVQAAIQDEAAQKLLAKALQNTTSATRKQIDAVEDYITKAQMASGFNDNELRPAFATLTRVTRDSTKSMELLNLAQDISRATGRDLGAVSIGLSRAYGGNFTALQRLGVQLPDNIKKSKDFNAVTEQLTTLFGGSAAAYAETYAGKLAILKERTGEASESLGTFLLPVVTKFVDALNTNVIPAVERIVGALGQGGLAGGARQASAEFFKFTGNLTGIGKDLLNLINFFVGLKIATMTWAAVTVVAAGTVKAALISTGIGAIVVLVGLLIGRLLYLIETSETFRARMVKAIVVIAKAFEFLFNGLGRGIEMLLLNLIDIPKIDLSGLISSLGKVSTSTAVVSDTVQEARDNALGMAASFDSTQGLGGGGGGVKQAVDKASKAVTSYKAIQDGLNQTMKDASDRLDEAKKTFDNYSSSVAGTITNTINFGSALDRAAENSTTFFDELRADAGRTTEFAEKVKTLISMGLSETGVKQVLDAGVSAGTAIADSIINGGAAAITEINAMTLALESLADSVGDSAADLFAIAGQQAGQAYIAALTAELVRAQQASAEQTAKSEALVADTLKKYKKSGKGLSKKEKAKIEELATSLGVAIPAMAKGGIVTQPTLALIGEAGPEAVVPLSGRNAPMGNQITINVNAGMGADGASIGREIVDAIKRYERTSGPVFASA
jgi:hypothetical protein